MRVLHLYGGGLAYGGVERLLLQLARYREHAPALAQDFALCYPGKLAGELSSVGVTPRILGPARSSRPWQVARLRRRLRRDIEPSYDMVVCHAWWTHAVFAPAVRRSGIPLALFVHNHLTGRGWLEAWARLTRPDFAIALSPAIADSIPNMYRSLPVVRWFPPVDLPPPLAPDRRDAVRSRLRTPPRNPVILQASRLEPWKGHRLLLEAMAGLKTNPTCTLWFAGAPQLPQERRYYASLQQTARELGIDDRIRWLGHAENMAELMLSADIYCQPNTAPEPFGLVFAEALASGLPVVSTAGGGPDGFITPACGALVTPSPAAVAAALDVFLTDAHRRSSAAIAARTRAQAMFDPATQLLDFQNTLLAAPGVRP